MPSKQLTKCFEPQQNLRLGPLNRFQPPPPEYYYITDRSKTVLQMRFSVSLVLLLVSLLFSPSVCLGEFKLGLCIQVAAFLERAAHFVKRMFSVFCLFVILVVSHFGFYGKTVFLIH